MINKDLTLDYIFIGKMCNNGKIYVFLTYAKVLAEVDWETKEYHILRKQCPAIANLRGGLCIGGMYVFNNKLYMLSSDVTQMISYDPATEEYEVIKIRDEGALNAFVGMHIIDDSMYILVRDHEEMYCYNTVTGELTLENFKLPFPYDRRSRLNDIDYIISKDQSRMASCDISAKATEVFPLSQQIDGSILNLRPYKDHFIFTTTTGHIYSLTTDGQVEHIAATGSIRRCMPTFNGDKIIQPWVEERCVMEIDVKTGEYRSIATFPEDYSIDPKKPYFANRALMLTPDGVAWNSMSANYMCAYNKQSGTISWHKLTCADDAYEKLLKKRVAEGNPIEENFRIGISDLINLI